MLKLNRPLLIALPIALVISLLSPLSARADGPDLTGYHVTFFDDFDELSVSPHGPMRGARWNARTPYNGDFGAAAFRDPSADFPFTVADSLLRIEARRNAGAGKWESGLLSSIGTDGEGFSQRYGYFEMRAKFPAGDGLWSAFWLMTRQRVTQADNRSLVNVEIDVVEYYGQRPDRYSTNLHRWDRDHTDGNQSTHAAAHEIVSGITDGFHTYGLLIEEDHITYYFDGVEQRKDPTPEEAKGPMFVLLNLALDPTVAPFDDALSPSSMLVDYVKVMANRPSPVALAKYRFDASSAASSDTHEHSAAGDFAASDGLSARFNPGSGRNPPVIYAAADTTADSEAGALASGDYFAFTVAPDAGRAISLESLEFKVSAGWGNTTGYGAAVYSSVDGFDSTAARIHSTGDVVAPNTQFISYVADLTGARFQQVSQPVEFRLYLWDAANSPSSELRIDDVILHGLSD